MRKSLVSCFLTHSVEENESCKLKTFRLAHVYAMFQQSVVLIGGLGRVEWITD